VQFAYLFALFKRIRLHNICKDNESYFHFINRKLVKNPIMTYFYGSSILTRCDSYLDSFIEQAIGNNRKLTKNSIKAFRKFSTYIDHHLRALG
jgi:hypothetical protein